MCKQILVEVKNIYGHDVVYPACKTARLFADIAGTITLTPFAIGRIKSLGYEVRIENKGLVL